ncbi:hypothetical protein K501DRAFT_330627 [Backusella circina FSU 941]|nr:hypothetical protein K501DRAFT_330627 [Backusella circina FSU 941]
MAVGTLTIAPVSLRGLPSGLSGARFFVGCFVNPNDKHRTHSNEGPEPQWKDELTCNVSENDHFLALELVDENSSTGLVAHSEVALDKVFKQGKDSNYVQFKNSLNEPFCEILVNLFFSGTNTVGSVSSSFGEMKVHGNEHISYSSSSFSQTTTYHNTPSHQSSMSSLGPAQPVPENYGGGAPPPFNPPPYSQNPVSDLSESGTRMPGGSKDQQIDYSKIMTREEFEKRKEKGSIPKWAVYVGAAVALGVGIYAAHEYKEHHEKQKKEEERRRREEARLQYMPAYGMGHGYPGMPTGLHGQGNMIGLSKKEAKRQEKMARKAEKQALRMQRREMRHRGRGRREITIKNDSDQLLCSYSTGDELSLSDLSSGQNTKIDTPTAMRNPGHVNLKLMIRFLVTNDGYQNDIYFCKKHE